MFFITFGLVDEREVIAPLILGQGKQLFSGAHQANLTHTDTETFTSGNVLITYNPAAPRHSTSSVE